MHRATMIVIVCMWSSAAAAANLLKPGDRFPAWSLTDHTNAVVASSDLAGRTYLLWFYPKAMTPGCTAEGDGLRDRIDAFARQNITIVGVSFDAPADNAAFVRQEKFPFRLLSDTNRSLAMAVGAADAPTQPVARRISYLIGGDGRVLHAYDSVDPGKHATEVLSDIDAVSR